MCYPRRVTRDTQSAFLVALPGKTYGDWDAADREKVLRSLLDPYKAPGRFGELRPRLQLIREHIGRGKQAEAVARRQRGSQRANSERDARGSFGNAEALIGDLLGPVSYGL